MLTTRIVVTICHHTKPYIIDCVPYAVLYIPVTYLFYNSLFTCISIRNLCLFQVMKMLSDVFFKNFYRFIPYV